MPCKKVGDFMTIRNVRIKEDDYGLTVAMPKTRQEQMNSTGMRCSLPTGEPRKNLTRRYRKRMKLFMHQQTDLDEEPEEAEELEQEEGGMNMGM